jgi:mono/diheme cytochrome c family protein
LNGEGAKVQPAWLFKFLKQPMPLRPWLKVRMPTFHLSDRETKTLVEYFAAVDNVDVPFVHIDESRIDREHLRAGKVLMSDDYFACFSCHQRGDRSPEGPPEGWAPDLAMARERLNPDWIADWLRNPQAVMPGTKMPAFYEAAEDGTAMGGPDDILDGDNERQLRALRDYIMVLQDADRLLAETHSNGSQLASVEDSAPEEMEPAPEI